MGHGSLDGLISFAYEAGHLRRLPRAGWTLAGVPNGESVAEHSFRVAVLAYLIASEEGANAEHAAVLGLFHDLPETRTGDTPSVGWPYVRLVDPREVIADQVAVLPEQLGEHIDAAVDRLDGASGDHADGDGAGGGSAAAGAVGVVGRVRGAVWYREDDRAPRPLSWARSVATGGPPARCSHPGLGA